MINKERGDTLVRSSVCLPPPALQRWFKLCEVQIEPPTPRRMVWKITFLAFRRLQRTSCCFLGRVSSQYLTLTMCISLLLTLSSWALCTSLRHCLGCGTWCKWGVVGDLGFIVGEGVIKMASGRQEVSLSLV